jgi:hypothetical protein
MEDRSFDFADYTLISYNFQIGDLLGNETQMDLPKDVSFICNTISVFPSKEPINDGEGLIQDIAFSLLRALSLTVKVRSKDQVVVTPIADLPLDLFYSNDRVNSVTSAEVFSISDLLGSGIVFSPDEDNLLVVYWNTEDPFTEVVKSMFPCVDGTTLYSWYESALRYLNSLQICLNGVFVKNTSVKKVSEKIAKAQSGERISLSYRVNIVNKYERNKDENTGNISSYTVRQLVSCSEGVSVEFGEYLISNDQPPVKAIKFSVTLPKYPQTMLVKDVGAVFFPFPEEIGVGAGNSDYGSDNFEWKFWLHADGDSSHSLSVPTMRAPARITVFTEEKQYDYWVNIVHLLGDDLYQAVGELDKIMFSYGAGSVNNRVVGIRDMSGSVPSISELFRQSNLLENKLMIQIDSLAFRAIRTMEQNNIKYDIPKDRWDFDQTMTNGFSFVFTKRSDSGWLFVLPPMSTVRIEVFVPLREIAFAPVCGNCTDSGVALWQQGRIFLIGYLVGGNSNA